MSKSTEMEFIREFLVIFRMFQFCGFAPFSLPINGKKSSDENGQKKWYIYNGALIIYFSAIVVHNIMSYKEFLEGNSREMLTYLSFTIIAAVRMITLIISVESILNSKQQIQFLQQLNVIDRIFNDELHVQMNFKQMRRVAFFWLSIWLTKSFILMAMVLAEVLNEDSTVWNKILWLFLTMPLVVSVMRYFQIMQYIQSLGDRIEAINTQLNEIYVNLNRLNVSVKDLPQKKRRINNKTEEQEIRDKIVSLRRIFYILWENSIVLNRAFRWSLLLLIATSFVIILVNYYRVLVWLFINRDSKEIEQVILFTIWSSGHAFYFIKLSSTCHHISQKVRCAFY